MVEGQQSLATSAQDDCFADFAPKLKHILELISEKAEALGYEDHKYDALLDEYEPDAKTNEISQVLGELVDRLSPLVAAIQQTGRSAPVEILSAITTSALKRDSDGPSPNKSVLISIAADSMSRLIRSAKALGRTTAALPLGTTSIGSRRFFRHLARSGTRDLRAGAGARTIRAAVGPVRVAGNP